MMFTPPAPFSSKSSQRVAKAMMFAASGYSKCVTKELGSAVFSEESVSLGKEFSNVVLVRDIEFHSTHEADLMPFYGRVHVAYVPKNGKVIGLSKFARITEVGVNMAAMTVCPLM
jgi:GTP cyclohydrolase I